MAVLLSSRTLDEPSFDYKSEFPNMIEIAETENTSLPPPEPAGLTMLEKLEKAAPYNIFFNIVKSPRSHNDPGSIKFRELLCPSLGNLQSSLQINYRMDPFWLMRQYKYKNCEKKPLTILYGFDPWEEEDIQELKAEFPNVKSHFIEMEAENACHHTKMGIYFYEDDSLRVVVSSTNLYGGEWSIYNNQLWVSPPCPRLQNGTGESPTGFKSSLLKYLNRYKLEDLEPWIEHVKNADFSSVKVFLITSSPGDHFPNDPDTHLQQMETLLKRHCHLPAKGALLWKIVAQASSLGHYGKSPANSWLFYAILKSLEGHKQIRPTSRLRPSLNVIYPSLFNVLKSYLSLRGAGCLAYQRHFRDMQPWLKNYLHHWFARRLDRSRVIPHSKSYCRVSPCFKKMAWFLLTSANISKSAWGFGVLKKGNVYVKNYEVGVLFFPQFFDEEYFEIDCVEKNERLFPIMFDFPLLKYRDNDEPWCGIYKRYRGKMPFLKEEKREE